MDKFRLRRFVEKLDAMGEVETHEAQTNLSDIAVVIENSPKVLWFKNVGPEKCWNSSLMLTAARNVLQ
jgi:hypothetical protein